MPEAFLGVDIGTTGCRATAIDAERRILTSAAVELPAPRQPRPGVAEQEAEIWWAAFCKVTRRLVDGLAGYRPTAICADGTSGTLVITDAAGHPVCAAMMYNDQRGSAALHTLRAVAPADSPVQSASSSLAKLLVASDAGGVNAATRVMHQAEWVLGRLAGRFDTGDENNCLKLGYDQRARRWPQWLAALGLRPEILPRVVPPGTPLGKVAPALAEVTGLPAGLIVCAGTTDSTAASLAAGIVAAGDGVTSLGSTLVLKILSIHPVESAAFGVYSQRIDDLWLVGGASNSGGSVLRNFFTDTAMAQMTDRLDFDRPTGLDYYPLPRTGERFPVNDPNLAPRLTPRPDNPVRFFQALLEGLMRIEKQGYDALRALGAGYPCRVMSSGGGASNLPWSRARAKRLGVPVTTASNPAASYGAALIALRGARRQSLLGEYPAQ